MSTKNRKHYKIEKVQQDNNSKVYPRERKRCRKYDKILPARSYRLGFVRLFFDTRFI